MKKLLKLLVLGFGVLVILIISAGIIITNLDPNNYKKFIITKVKEQTGRDLILSGPIKLEYYPWINIEINGITLGNAKGFGEQPFFHSDYLTLRVKALPLLKKQVNMDIIQIQGARIYLAKNKQGITNWDDLVQGESKSGKSSDSGFNSGSLAALMLGGLDIRNASLIWDDQAAGINYSMTNLNLSTGNLILGEPIDLKISLNAEANRPKISGNAELNGTIEYDLEAQHYSVQPLQFEAVLKGKNIPGGQTKLKLMSMVDVNLGAGAASISDLVFDVLDTHVDGNITAYKLQSGKPAVKSKLHITGKDLSLLFKVAEIEPLAGQLARLKDKSFNLNADLDADMEHGDANLVGLIVNMLGAVIKGEVHAGNIHSKTPSFKGHFSAQGPDLPLLLELAGCFEQSGKQTIGKLGRQLSKVGNKKFDMGTQFDINMKQGLVSVPEISVKSLGIVVAGKLNGENLNKPNGKMDGYLSINGENLTRLFKALEQDKLANVLKSVSIDTGISGNMKGFSVNPLGIKAVLSGKQIPNSPVKIKFNAATKANFEKQTLKIDSLSLNGLGLNIEGNIDVQQIINAPVFEGNLKVDRFNLRKLLRQLNQRAPQTADNKVFRKVALQTGFSGSTTNMNLKKINILMDDTRIQGDFSVNEFTNPDIRFALNINKLDADRYLPPSEKTKKRKTAAKDISGAGASPGLPMETLRTLKIKGDLLIGELIISNAKLSDINLQLDAKDGNIKMDPMTANLYKGKYNGDIFLDATKKLPKIILNAALKDIQVEPLLNDVTGKAKLRGKGNFNAALTTTGQDAVAMKKNLNGEMHFSFKDGAVKGFNIGKFLRSLNSIKQNTSYKVSDKEETDFAKLTGNPILKNGMVTLDDLDGSAPALHFQGKGLLADLVKERINYTASATVVETSKDQASKDLAQLNGITIPILINGPLQNPKIEPDIKGVVTSLATKGILDKIGIKIPGITSPTQPPTEEQSTKQPIKTDDPNEALKNKVDEKVGNFLKKIFN